MNVNIKNTTKPNYFGLQTAQPCDIKGVQSFTRKSTANESTRIELQPPPNQEVEERNLGKEKGLKFRVINKFTRLCLTLVAHMCIFRDPWA